MNSKSIFYRFKEKKIESSYKSHCLRSNSVYLKKDLRITKFWKYLDTENVDAVKCINKKNS